MAKFWEIILEFFRNSGIAGFFQSGGWLNLIMLVIAGVLIFLAIRKKFEPYLLLPIAFGMQLVNLPFVAKEIFAKGATEYNEISFASVAGLTSEQSKYIFSELGLSSATTKEIYNLVNSKDFLANSPEILGFTSETVSNIKNIY